MTRDGLIEVMARALCVDDGVDPDVAGYDRTGRDFPNWYVVQGTAETVLAAIEAAGVRLVPGTLTKDMCMACMYSDQAATGVDRIDYHAVLHRRYAAQLAASPYAQKDETK